MYPVFFAGRLLFKCYTLLVLDVCALFFPYDRKQAKVTKYKNCIMQLCLETRQKCKNCLEKELVSVE